VDTGVMTVEVGDRGRYLIAGERSGQLDFFANKCGWL